MIIYIHRHRHRYRHRHILIIVLWHYCLQGHNMKWATGLMFIRMAEALKTEFASVRCPFVILHDPYDKVVNIKGSHDLLEMSLTPPDQKTLVEVIF